MRKKILQMAFDAGASSAHFGGALSIVEILATLFSYKMNIKKKKDIGWDSRDRFILSKGHACLAYYSSLNLKGFISDEDLKRDFDYVSKNLGITSDELQMFMDSPNKTFRDYKNQMWLYDLGVRVLRAIGIERGGKR